MNRLPGTNGRLLVSNDPQVKLDRVFTGFEDAWTTLIDSLDNAGFLALALTAPDDRHHPVRAGVHPFIAPHDRNPDNGGWLLIIESSTSATVIEYPTIPDALNAFTAHVKERAAAHGHYGYFYGRSDGSGDAYPTGWRDPARSSAQAPTAPHEPTTPSEPTPLFELVASYTTDTPTQYGLVNVHRFFGNLIRVEILHHADKARSYATVSVGLTPDALATIINAAPDDWSAFPPPSWSLSADKTAALAELDERLYLRAARLING